MSKNNLITHIINEDYKSFKKDSLELLNEFDWTTAITNPKKLNVIDHLSGMGKNKINSWLDERLKYIKANGVEREYMNQKKELNVLTKELTKRASFVNKLGKNLAEDEELYGISNKILQVRKRMMLLYPYIRDNSGADKISDKVSEIDNRENKIKKDMEKLEHEIRNLQSQVSIALPPEKYKLEKQIEQKFKKLAAMGGYGGSFSSGGTSGQ